MQTWVAGAPSPARNGPPIRQRKAAAAVRAGIPPRRPRGDARRTTQPCRRQRPLRRTTRACGSPSPGRSARRGRRAQGYGARCRTARAGTDALRACSRPPSPNQAQLHDGTGDVKLKRCAQRLLDERGARAPWRPEGQEDVWLRRAKVPLLLAALRARMRRRCAAVSGLDRTHKRLRKRLQRPRRMRVPRHVRRGAPLRCSAASGAKHRRLLLCGGLSSVLVPTPPEGRRTRISDSLRNGGGGAGSCAREFSFASSSKSGRGRLPTSVRGLSRAAVGRAGCRCMSERCVR